MITSRTEQTLRQVDRTHVIHRGRRFTYFGGCDYFRLSSHPQIRTAVTAGLKRFGLNVSASRVTTGNHELYERLERELAKFFRVESAVLAPNGLTPGLMVAEVLAGQFSHALMDERAHGCLVDAAQLLDCPVIRFRHCDADDLSQRLGKLGHTKPIVLTDGMFSHDGSVAPLQSYLEVLPAGSLLLVDDAHGVGVLGQNGRGTVEHAKVSTSRIIQVISLSKAFGVFGGVVLGTRRLRNVVMERSRTFAGTTPLPLPLANAVLKSLSIHRSGNAMRARLRRNVERVRNGLRNGGVPVPDLPGPILSFTPSTGKEADRVNRALLRAGIHPPFIHYPGGPASGYFRFAISSEHAPAQLDALIRSAVSS